MSPSGEKFKPFLLDLSDEELCAQFAEWGEPAYRVRQVLSWIIGKGAASFAGMSNLSKGLRIRLSRRFRLGDLELADRVAAADGTEKFLFRLRDKNLIESALIPSSDRCTACISTQVGCRLGCTFCASTRAGLVRDLGSGEILTQVLTLDAVRPLTHLVVMGIGEPLENYDATLRALRRLVEYRGWAARRITVSTSGLVPEIERLAREDLGIRLSVSLHATRQELRWKIMPISARYPLG
ncbi:MAG: 23S rRNA (adenine(2503)-C(2))-methyltransferase RlmN, partial [Candidatus Omnitrophica bacterium]|nr:23S rRNA (adenine(2503)-C(2))-methyltransferase RlmN [Candidatus Omnitrophota bacterium]